MISRLTNPKTISKLLLAILLSLVVLNTYAINLMFMSKQAPARKFSDEDWQYLDRAIIHSLQYVNNGASHIWDNPNTPAEGMVEVLESLTNNDLPCRRLRLTNHYKQLQGVTEFVFCKQPDGEWKVSQ